MPNGYAMLSVGQRSRGEKRSVYAHRFSYENTRGSIRVGMDLDHPACQFNVSTSTLNAVALKKTWRHVA